MSMLKVTTVFTGWPGAPGLMTHYFARTGVWSDAAAQNCSDRVQNSLAECRNLFLSSTGWRVGVIGEEIDEATGDLIDSYTCTTTASNGLGSDNLLPPASQICVGWVTDGVVEGRRVRGRTFLGPLALTSAHGDGTPTNDALGHANAFGAEMRDMGATTERHVIWHRPTPGNSDGSHHDVVSHQVRDHFAVLRSRRQ